MQGEHYKQLKIAGFSAKPTRLNVVSAFAGRPKILPHFFCPRFLILVQGMERRAPSSTGRSRAGDSRRKDHEKSIEAGQADHGKSIEDLEKYICADCDGTGVTPNPCPKRHPGPHLKFANHCQCLVCRNMFNTALKHCDREKIRQTNKKNAKKKKVVQGIPRSVDREVRELRGQATSPVR